MIDLSTSVLLVSIGVILASSISLYIAIMVIRCSKKRRSQLKNKFTRHISYLLIQIITSDQKEMPFKHLRKFIIRNENPHVSVKSLVTNEFMKLARAISNDQLSALQGLFLTLGLQKFNIDRAKNGTLRQKLKAFEVLSKLKVITALPVINQYVVSENKTLRAEAIMSLMRLSSNPLFFLDNQKVTISVWEAMKIHGMLKELPEESIPQFTNWLGHKEKSVVLFCLRMILHYQQKGDLELLTLYSQSKSAKVAEEAQKALVLRQILEFSEPDEQANPLEENQAAKDKNQNAESKYILSKVA